MRTSSLVERTGHVDAHATLLRAAVIAAHAVHAPIGGFRAVDVRFFFRLFGNWLEHDVVRPSQDIDLTQLRRTFDKLKSSGHLTRARPIATRHRGQFYKLAGSGMVDLAEKLVDERGAGLEEALFVLHFAVSYRAILRARVLASGERAAAVTMKRLATVLDPKRIAKRALRECERLVHDLREKLASDAELERQLMNAATPEDAIASMRGIGVYQLERIQPFKALLVQLPEDLRHLELSGGIRSRRELIFTPLLGRAQEELRLVTELAATLGVSV